MALSGWKVTKVKDINVAPEQVSDFVQKVQETAIHTWKPHYSFKSLDGHHTAHLDWGTFIKTAVVQSKHFTKFLSELTSGTSGRNIPGASFPSTLVS